MVEKYSHRTKNQNSQKLNNLPLGCLDWWRYPYCPFHFAMGLMHFCSYTVLIIWPVSPKRQRKMFKRSEKQKNRYYLPQRYHLETSMALSCPCASGRTSSYAVDYWFIKRMSALRGTLTQSQLSPPTLSASLGKVKSWTCWRRWFITEWKECQTSTIQKLPFFTFLNPRTQ